MTEQLSNCCKAEAYVDKSDEGTSCFVCTQCNKPCDLYCAEQVSVIQFGIGLSGKVEEVILPIEEYERLKRLDENVKQKIERLKTLTHWPSMSDSLIKLLESLYK
jgi:hypothetical protein